MAGHYDLCSADLCSVRCQSGIWYCTEVGCAVSGGQKELRGRSRWALTANAWVVYLFFYAPIALLVLYSFSDDNLVGRWGGFTFRWYGEFAENDEVQNALGVVTVQCGRRTLNQSVRNQFVELCVVQRGSNMQCHHFASFEVAMTEHGS